MKRITLFVCVLSAVVLLAGAARADALRATVTASGVTARLVGEVSLSELAASEANRQALQAQQNVPFVEQPVHRLPDGSLTAEPSQATLDALDATPLTLEPNVATRSARDTKSFASRRGFIGIRESDNAKVNGYELEPPDQGLAVNHNVAVEIVNNIVEVFNATTGAPLAGPVSTAAFFLAPGGTDLTDTQAFFDPTTNRWFLDELIFNGSTIEDIAVAVSETSNATGSYFIYQIRAASDDLAGCDGIDCFPVYPKAGYDQNIFIIDVDLFNTTKTTQPFVEAAAYVLPKSQLIAGSTVHYARLDFGNSFVVQPSVPAPGEPFVSDANGTEYLMEARNIDDGSHNIRVWAISNTGDFVSDPLSLQMSFEDISGELYGPTVPSRQPNVVGPYCKSQGVTSAPTLDGGYNSFQSTIQLASGKLYGALAFGRKDAARHNRDVIAWFVVKPSVTDTGSVSATILKKGYIVPTKGYSLSYPAFGLKRNGKGVLGFAETSRFKKVPGGFPSASYIQFTGTGTTGSIIVKGQGKTSDDGFSGCRNPGPGQVGRWGDYGAATVDAATGYLYTANELIPFKTLANPQFANWGTYITQLH
jgi:hypothetical protein